MRAAATAGGSALDDEEGVGDWEHAKLDVELDMGSMPPPACAPQADRETSAAAQSPSGPMRSVRTSAAGTTTMAAAPIADDVVEAVAQYGERPTNVLLAPLYAWRVFRRKPELEKAYALRRQTHEAGARGLRRQRKEIFEAVARRHPQSVQALQSHLDAADAMVVQQQSQFSEHNQAVARQLEGLEKRREGLEERLAQRRRDLQLAQVGVEEARRRSGQLETDIQRLVDRAARARDGAGLAPQTVDVDALEREQQVLVKQLPTRQGAIRQAQQVVHQRRQELLALESEIQGVDQQVGQAERNAQATQASTFSALNAAQDARLGAYEDALRNVVEQAPQLLEPAEKLRLAELEESIVRLDEDLEVHRLAVNAFDQNVRRQGVGIVVVGAVVVLLLLASLMRVG